MGLRDFFRRRPLSGGAAVSGSAYGGTVAPGGSLSAAHVPKREPSAPTNRLDELCERHGATYERTLEDNGHTVVVRAKLADGSVVIGRGPSTREAVTDLAFRLERSA